MKYCPIHNSSSSSSRPPSVSPVFDTALLNDNRQNQPPHICGLCHIHQHGQHRLHYSWCPQHRDEKIEGSRRQCVKCGSKHKFSCLTTHCASLVLRFHSNGTTHARRQRNAPPSTTSVCVITRNSKNLKTVPSKQFRIPRPTQNPPDYTSCI